jgi:hypothetical protein
MKVGKALVEVLDLWHISTWLLAATSGVSHKLICELISDLNSRDLTWKQLDKLATGFDKIIPSTGNYFLSLVRYPEPIAIRVEFPVNLETYLASSTERRELAFLVLAKLGFIDIQKVKKMSDDLTNKDRWIAKRIMLLHQSRGIFKKKHRPEVSMKRKAVLFTREIVEQAIDEAFAKLSPEEEGDEGDRISSSELQRPAGERQP